MFSLSHLGAYSWPQPPLLLDLDQLPKERARAEDVAQLEQEKLDRWLAIAGLQRTLQDKRGDG